MHMSHSKTKEWQFYNNYDNSVLDGPIALKLCMRVGTHLAKYFHVLQLWCYCTCAHMYYWLQNDVRPPMAGRLTGTVGCAASHPGSAAQYISLASDSPQTRRVGPGQGRATMAVLSMMLVTITLPRNYLHNFGTIK